MNPSRSELRNRFVAGSGRVAAAAAGGHEHAPPAGGWTSAEIVRHLIAVETEVWHARFDQLAAGESPQWTSIEPRFDEGPEDRLLSELIAAFSARRDATVERVDGFDVDGWSRSGVHATYGVLDVAGLLRLAIDHDDEHIRTLLERSGWRG